MTTTRPHEKAGRLMLWSGIFPVNICITRSTVSGGANQATMDHAVSSLLITLVAVIVATKLLGELAQRLGQPTVLGELLAGILLGASVLGVLDPSSPVIHALSEIGVLILLFEIGLHTDVRSLARVGGVSLTVASAGVAVPFALGYVTATPTEATVSETPPTRASDRTSV